MKKTITYLLFLVLLSSCSYFKRSTPSLKLIPYMAGEKWGYIDNAGKILINPQFNYAGIFMGGIALVQSADNKYGYINEDGKYIINPAYKTATPFCEGLACVVPENGKPQFITSKGEVKFTVNEGEYCGVFSEGLAAVKVGEKWGYFNESGEIKINPQFDQARPFSEGLAAVAQTNKETGETLWGFINKKGELVINHQFKGWNQFQFQDGLCMVSDGKKYGYIGTDGKYIINPQFDGATKFKNNLAIFSQGSMLGYIDKEGKIVINPQFSDASYFSENIAAVKSSDGKCGYIDKEGKYTINPQFEKASDFFGDIAFVRSADKWGIIDKNGKYIVNPQFDQLNTDLESYKFEIVQSDYFDVAGIADKFLEGTEQTKFRNLSSATTIAELKSTYPDLTVNDYDWSGNSTNKITLNDNAYIADMRFVFAQSPVLEQKPVYRTVQKQDYWKGSYTAQELDHYENVPNDKANLSAVSFTLYLANGKAQNKSAQIIKAITEGLQTKIGASNASTSNLQGPSMSVTWSAGSSYTSYNISFEVVTAAAPAQ